MKSYTLYSLVWNHKIYISTDSIEIYAFASWLGEGAVVKYIEETNYAKHKLRRVW